MIPLKLTKAERCSESSKSGISLRMIFRAPCYKSINRKRLKVMFQNGKCLRFAEFVAGRLPAGKIILKWVCTRLKERKTKAVQKNQGEVPLCWTLPLELRQTLKKPASEGLTVPRVTTWNLSTLGQRSIRKKSKQCFEKLIWNLSVAWGTRKRTFTKCICIVKWWLRVQ